MNTTHIKDRTEQDEKSKAGQSLGTVDLRDYFAAKALPSVYEQYVITANMSGWNHEWKLLVAAESYQIADAMLRAREAT